MCILVTSKLFGIQFLRLYPHTMAILTTGATNRALGRKVIDSSITRRGGAIFFVLLSMHLSSYTRVQHGSTGLLPIFC
jgi:hypothetical protein